MQMQEPEQLQPSAQESSAYGTGYTGSYASDSDDQQDASGIGIGNSYQGQKLYPGAGLSARGKTFSVFTITLSSIVFALMIVGIVASALVLKNAAGQQQLVAAGVMGLVSSIVALLASVAIFVLAVVDLVIRTGYVGRRRGRMGTGSRYH
ncbi:MAG: hypothetical protein ABI396_00410 [Ktedonobacteraceae bacterium]